MIYCYASVNSDNSFTIYDTLSCVYNDISSFDKLSDDDRAKFGYYKCEINNEIYNEYTQERSVLPILNFDSERKNIIIGNYIITDIPLDNIISKRIQEVNLLHDKKLYTDVNVQFPDGPAVIQFRDERDRTNLSNVSSGSMALCIAGLPSELMTYRTLDDKIHMVPANIMMQISMYVLNLKQEIVKTALFHKDNLKLLTNVNDVINYDITSNL